MGVRKFTVLAIKNDIWEEFWERSLCLYDLINSGESLSALMLELIWFPGGKRGIYFTLIAEFWAKICNIVSSSSITDFIQAAFCFIFSVWCNPTLCLIVEPLKTKFFTFVVLFSWFFRRTGEEFKKQACVCHDYRILYLGQISSDLAQILKCIRQQCK